MNLLFGTDGVRGPVGAELNESSVRALGLAVSKSLKASRVVVGFDTRESSPQLASAISEGLLAGGLDVLLLGVTPTPAVAYVASLEEMAGVMVSASHNLWSDNGVKIFDSGGRKLTDESQNTIQADWKITPSVEKLNLSVPDIVSDNRWVDFLVASIEPESLNGMKLVIDCANGATSGVARSVFSRLGAQVSQIHASPNGRNINHKCGSTDPSDLQREVVQSAADVGLAFDGDGDRVVAVAADGTLLNGDHLLAICAVDRMNRSVLSDSTVVITPMANLGLRNGLTSRGIVLYEAPVGDRHVLEAMDSGGWVLGGEQSGHLIFSDLATTGDGLLTAIQVLDAVRRSGQTLGDLATELVKEVPQILINVPVVQPVSMVAEEMVDDIAVASMELGKGGRVLVRPSGTEPVVRIMVEALDSAVAEVVAQSLSEAARRRDKGLSGGATLS